MAALAIVLVLALVVAGAYGGYHIGLGEAGPALKKNKRLANDIIELREAARAAQQRAVRAEKTAEIDRLAAESVRQEWLAHRHEVAELENDVDFYRRLMAPDELDKGLAIYAFKLSLDEQTGHYEYSALVTQAGGQNRVVKGSLSISLLVEYVEVNDSGSDSGAADAIPARQALLSLKSLPEFEGKLPAKLRFRFFQTIEGSFKLPEQGTPVSMVIALESAGKKPQQLEKTFNWQELSGAASVQ